MSKTFSQPFLGPRIRHARQQMKMTQDILREKLGYKDRQTVSDIETGARALKADELVAICDALNIEVEYLLTPFSVAPLARWHWRVAASLPDAALSVLAAQADGLVALYGWLEAQNNVQRSVLKRQLRISTDSTVAAVEQSARRLAEDFQWGQTVSLKQLLQFAQHLDTPVLMMDPGEGLDRSAFSGAVCEVRGQTYILLNRQRPDGLLRYDLACLLFEDLTWFVREPVGREANGVGDRGSRRAPLLAPAFAAVLLSPEGVAAAAECEQDRCAPARLAQRFSEEFVQLLHRALDRGQISARKAARTVGLSLAELRQVFTDYGQSSPFDL